MHVTFDQNISKDDGARFYDTQFNMPLSFHTNITAKSKTVFTHMHSAKTLVVLLRI